MFPSPKYTDSLRAEGVLIHVVDRDNGTIIATFDLAFDRRRAERDSSGLSPGFTKMSCSSKEGYSTAPMCSFASSNRT